MCNIAESERGDEKYIKYLVGDPEGKRIRGELEMGWKIKHR
jgi:hypothetical protein